MESNSEQSAESGAAFQRIWTETATKLFQASLASTPYPPPPEVLRQIRSGIFQALAQSWEEFMRSPQFLENMRQWMDNAISFRKMTTEFMGRVRNEVQAPSREDLETVRLQVRHMEKRLLDRLDELATQLGAVQGQLPGAVGPGLKSRPRSSMKVKAGATQARRGTRNGKRVKA